MKNIKGVDRIRLAGGPLKGRYGRVVKMLRGGSAVVELMGDVPDEFAPKSCDRATGQATRRADECERAGEAVEVPQRYGERTTPVVIPPQEPRRLPRKPKRKCVSIDPDFPTAARNRRRTKEQTNHPGQMTPFRTADEIAAAAAGRRV